MTLDILIPHYHESFHVLKPLLDSITIQQNVNFNDIQVIIFSDGFENDLAIPNIYPFNIIYLKKEHSGVSATRNACLDYSKADYVMFCDADDMFLNVCGLFIIFTEMKRVDPKTHRQGFDCFVSAFMEEGRNQLTNEAVYATTGEDYVDSTFVHGKVYSRKFLTDNNIRWNEDLTIHQDSYFNTLCQLLSTCTRFCPTPFYLWKWREDSVCRHDKDYIFKTYTKLLDSNSALVREMIKRNRMDEAEKRVTSMIYDAFYTLNRPNWLPEEHKKTELRIKAYYEEFKEVFKENKEIFAQVRNHYFKEGLILENITFNQWIKHIEKLKVA